MHNRIQEQLFEACRKLDKESALDALEKGADPNAYANKASEDSFIYNPDNVKYTPLSLVAKTYYHQLYLYGKLSNEVDTKAVELTQYLLNYGANVDNLDSGDFGNSCLHWAIVTYKEKLCALLIEHAKTFNKELINLTNNPAQSYYGSNPPLILALKCSALYLSILDEPNLTVPELLLKSGADVNAADHNGQTALHWAAIIRAPITFFDSLIFDNSNTVHYCLNSFSDSPGRLYEREISKSMVNINIKLMCNQSENSFTELGYFISDFNDTNPLGIDYNLASALERRNCNYNPDIAYILNSYELSINPPNTKEERYLSTLQTHQWSKLHYAIFYGDCKKVRELLAEGEDVSAKTKNGADALEMTRNLQSAFTFFWKEGKVEAKQCANWREIEVMLTSMNKS